MDGLPLDHGATGDGVTISGDEVDGNSTFGRDPKLAMSKHTFLESEDLCVVRARTAALRSRPPRPTPVGYQSASWQ